MRAHFVVTRPRAAVVSVVVGHGSNVGARQRTRKCATIAVQIEHRPHETVHQIVLSSRSLALVVVTIFAISDIYHLNFKNQIFSLLLRLIIFSTAEPK